MSPQAFEQAFDIQNVRRMWTKGKDIKHPNVQSGSKRSSPDLKPCPEQSSAGSSSNRNIEQALSSQHNEKHRDIIGDRDSDTIVSAIEDDREFFWPFNPIESET